LAIREGTSPVQHLGVASILRNLGELYSNQGSYSEAEQLYRRALAIDEKVLGADHPDVAADMSDLALLYDAQGNYTQAEALFNHALGICEKAFGLEHPGIVPNLEFLATFLRRAKRPAEAQKVEARARAIRAKHRPKLPANAEGAGLLWPSAAEPISKCA
jgi:tetratricopeptide (TPR) repeat protein